MERIQLLKLRAMCAALCVAILSTASAASADGPLKQGEILVANFDGRIDRVQPIAPYAVETITTKGDVSVAVANNRTIYTLDSEGGSGQLRLYKVDVESEQATLMSEFAGLFGDIAVEPSGKVLVAVSEGLVAGRLLRIDPTLALPQQAQEVLSHGQLGTNYGWGPAMKVATNGDIFVRGAGSGMFRVEGNSLVEFWRELPVACCGLPLDIDRKTGELVISRSPGLERASPYELFSGTSVFGIGNYPSGLDNWSFRIALEAGGSVLYSDNRDNVYRADPADNPSIPINIYPHDDVHDIEVVLPACANGLDDNGNGPADFPSEAGCLSPEDPFEFECSVNVGSSGSTGGPAGLLLLLGMLLWRRKQRT